MDIENTESVIDNGQDDVIETGDTVETQHLQEEVEEYTPSYTYKVKDEEREFDERVRGIITNKDTEEYIRDLYTKADGLDTYKGRVSAYEEDLSAYKTQLSQMQTGFSTLKEYREKGDYRKLFGALGVDEQSMLEYAYKVAQEGELPEEQRQAIQSQRQQEDRLAQLEQQLAAQTRERETMSVQHELSELESYVSTHGDLNTRMQTVGFNLRDEVLSYGITQTKLTGKEPSIGDAVNTVVTKFTKMLSPAPQQQEQQRKETLPVVNGSNQTAGQRRYTLDDLRKMSNQIH